MYSFLKLALVTAVIATPALAAFASDKPPIVLVHGAFADSSSWNGVIERLEKDGYSVTAIANPLRALNLTLNMSAASLQA